jgi:hypothetical protein
MSDAQSDGRLEARLTAAGSRLSERVLAEMYRDPFWSERFGERGRTHAGRDGDAASSGKSDGEIAQLLSFLADAVALDRPDLFAAHVRFAAASAERRGLPPGSLAALLDRLESALAALALGPAPARALAAAREALCR